MDNIQLGIEAGLSLLLLITIFYSIHLGRALSVLRRDRAEVINLVNTLQQSSVQAQNGIEHLRQTTELVGRQLNRTIEQAKNLRVELNGLCERGEECADRIEKMPLVSHASMRMENAAESNTDTNKSTAERNLLRALRMQKA
ncbi:DUF6468 domain-containing protein [Kozakia baliensis]|uniref:Uncharacterized protein n=1 Tax=Kozakia baliensis TaxID=153496 RepID=A0A1D8UUU5_9PROT|nr:DUF6468 domain-containing protein [Kozakia baliensis]AOX17422.1 hypothetical protein A0U89_10040 [Kozakia baliensis]AOX20298.1 hypothetical protein A0U90_08315 [Kozakia baliensis]GBR30442.1 hypothetical protein AA0488_1998 [Kozakia baliensis NRIC 0488]GEL63124.1 hypothetical protein KBA01_04100 [Kozakia baliensis]